MAERNDEHQRRSRVDVHDIKLLLCVVVVLLAAAVFLLYRIEQHVSVLN